MKALGFIFPGQGSQKIGMGLDFYENCPQAKDLLDEISFVLKIDFKKLLFTQNDDINKSEFTQPAIVLNSLMALLALFSFCPDLKAKQRLGHSLGEFTALASAKALSFNDTLYVVQKRGFFMQAACAHIKPGMLVVLGLKDELVERLCKKLLNEGKKIWPANYNCDEQIVLAGLEEDLQKAQSLFKEAGAKRLLPINMSVASHCPLLQAALKDFSQVLESYLLDDFAPVISNVDAKPYTDKKRAISLLSSQLVKPVLYKQSIKAIENELDCFVEFGASILKGLNKKISQKPTYSLTNMKEVEKFAKDILKSAN